MILKRKMCWGTPPRDAHYQLAGPIQKSLICLQACSSTVDSVMNTCLFVRSKWKNQNLSPKIGNLSFWHASGGWRTSRAASRHSVLRALERCTAVLTSDLKCKVTFKVQVLREASFKCYFGRWFRGSCQYLFQVLVLMCWVDIVQASTLETLLMFDWLQAWTAMFDNGSRTASSCASRKSELWYRGIGAAMSLSARPRFVFHLRVLIHMQPR